MQPTNPDGRSRILVTRRLPGKRWLDILIGADCRVEIASTNQALDARAILEGIGGQCDGVIGQLTETWDEGLFSALSAAGGRVYSNYAVGYDNVDVESATRHGIAVGNTPGVLTETTAELAVALTLAAARRIVESDAFMRSGHYHRWLPDLLLGKRLYGRTVGVVGAGRIGSAYALMMVRGFRMNLIYHGPHRKPHLENAVALFSEYLQGVDEPPVYCRYTSSLDDLLREADVVSLHPALTDQTRHLLDAAALDRMKDDAVLVNVSRGPVIDEVALVEHCKSHPDFRAALDVFEDEPAMTPGLADLPNVVLAPHIGSATEWTREGMSILAACNVVGVLQRWPAAQGHDVEQFLSDDRPQLTPSIVNARALGMPILEAD